MTANCCIRETVTVTTETVTETTKTVTRTVTTVKETVKTDTETVTDPVSERAVAGELWAGDCRLLHQRAVPIKAHGTTLNTQQLHYVELMLNRAVRRKRPMGC